MKHSLIDYLGAIAASAALLLGLNAHAAPLDFDGDGLSDLVGFYNQADGSTNELVYNILHSSDAQLSRIEFGANGDAAVPADYDGDGIADLAVVHINDTVLTWRLRLSSDALNITSQDFGEKGDTVLGGCNFDGDTKADLAVIRAGVLYVLKSSDATTVQVALDQTDYRRFYCADMNADAADDLVAQRDGSGISVFKVWTLAGENIVTANFGQAVNSILVSEINGDGVPRLGFVRGKRSYSNRMVFLVDGQSVTFRLPRYDRAGIGVFTPGRSNISGLVLKSTRRNRFIRYAAIQSPLAPETINIDQSETVLGAVNAVTLGAVSGEACDESHEVRDGVGTGYLWKPISDTTGNAVTVVPPQYHFSQGYVVKNGKILEKFYDKGRGNGNRQHWASRRRASSFPENSTFVGVKAGVRHCWLIENPNLRYD